MELFKRFTNKVAVISGAYQGVGLALAERFCQEQAAVVLLDKQSSKRAAALEKLSRYDTPTLAIDCDVSDQEACQQAIKKANQQFKHIDILVNNAGGAFCAGNDSLLQDLSAATLQGNTAVNLFSAFYLSQACLTHFVKQRAGIIVNIGSVNGRLAIAHPGYSAAKAGLLALTKQIAVEYGPHHIRSVLIAAGTIATENWDQRRQQQPDVFDKLCEFYPLKRVAHAAEIAAIAAFLCSEEASFISGCEIPVDGGLSAGLPALSEHLILDDNND